MKADSTGNAINLISDQRRFSEHIGELRTRLKKVFFAFLVILIVVVFVPANPVQQAQHLDQYLNLAFLNNTVIAAFLHQMRSYVLPTNWGLIAANGVGEGMEVYFVAALMVSLVLCMPVIAYETYKFIDPALKPEEKQLLYPFVVSTSLLFTVGTLFGYVIAKFLVLALAPFFQATSTQFLIDSAAFYYVVFLIIGSTGASFTAPVFVYALIRLRVIGADSFSRNHVVIWFALWIVTGLFLTPDGGPLLDLVIFIPIVVLVEAAVFLGRRGVRGSAGDEPKAICRHCSAPLAQGQLFCQECGRCV